MVAIRVTMVPHEHVVYTTGQVVDRDICPSRNSNCTHTTAADGTWHDVPYGACGMRRKHCGSALAPAYILARMNVGPRASIPYCAEVGWAHPSAILLNIFSTRLSHDPCLGTKTN